MLAAGLFFTARAGVAYRFFDFYDTGPATPTAAYALRWDDADLPVTFRLLDNDLARRRYPEVVRGAVEEAFATWNGVPTSRFRVELAEDPFRADQNGMQGINEIGFSGIFEPGDRRAFSVVRADDARTIQECDISLSPHAYEGHVDRWRDILEYVVLHEIGHCLGLLHSEMYPMSDWVEDVPATYFPPPVMSYSWTRSAELSEDDRVGASLLYPAPAFPRSRGAVAGRIVTAGGLPGRYTYVQALMIGERPRAGPGAFANENGYFLLEGLPPGRALLWVHPVLPWIGFPHGLPDASPSAGAEAVQDQWRWVKVTAGETSVIPTIVAPTGRRVASR